MKNHGEPKRSGVRRRRGVSRGDDPQWYKDAIIYEVRTRSFFDSNGDGIGDLRGLTSKLDYLVDLGVTAVWILPHYPSPGRDDCYDCSDYTGVHAAVGTLQDFDVFVREAHARGIYVIIELVLNHTSSQHPWFQRARTSPKGSNERNYYVWSDDDTRYRDARVIFSDFESSNWTWDPVARAYYWHRFFSHQPDLNYDHPAVHEAMLTVVDFWLERGVDGLRLDAVPYLYERDGTNCENLPETHAFLKKVRAHVDRRFSGRMLLAEANQWPEDAAAYFGNGDECHMNFHFPLMPRLFLAIQIEDRFPIVDILKQTPAIAPTCQWAMFLRNHDELTLEMVTDEERDTMVRVYAHEPEMRLNLGIRRRLAPLVENDRRKIELLNGLLFALPGTPVIYYGDEIGMGDNVWLGDRDGVRTPMQWSADRNAGFSRASAQRLILPINVEPEYHYEALNVAQQQSSPASLLWFMKRLIATRKRFACIGRGTMEVLTPSNPKVLAFVRHPPEGTRTSRLLVVANLSRHVEQVELDLSPFCGSNIVEAIGGTRLLPIGNTPYLLTLGGHAFYWLAIEAGEHEIARDRLPHVAPVIACTSLNALCFGDERVRLDSALASYLAARDPMTAGVDRATITGIVQVSPNEPDLFMCFLRLETLDGPRESYALPVAVVHDPVPAEHSIAEIAIHGDGTRPRPLLVEGTTVTAVHSLVELIAQQTRIGEPPFVVEGHIEPGVSLDASDLYHPAAVDSDRVGAVIATGSAVLKLLYRLEEGIAPEVELARAMAHGPEDVAGQMGRIVPRTLGSIERTSLRSQPTTLAFLEERVSYEMTGWEQAQSELGRMFDRVTAHPTDAPEPRRPNGPLLQLMKEEPPEEHRVAIGAYTDWAWRMGRKTAELHVLVASLRDPAFTPATYSAMDQRSIYQTGRNWVGRILGMLRHREASLPTKGRLPAGLLLRHEGSLMARLEPLRSERIDAQRIRCHGALQLGKFLFTGEDFILCGFGAGRKRRHLAERRRKRCALGDVAQVLRSFDQAAAHALRKLRPQDRPHAERWAEIWSVWASASFLRGYFEIADGSGFVPSAPLRSTLLDAALIEVTLLELRDALESEPESVWVPIRGLLSLLGV